MECGNCTICCKLTNIADMKSPSGIYCAACDQNVGCNIYEKRPQECRIFQCSWSQMEKAHIDLKPANCGVMFEKVNDTLMLGTIDGNLEDMSDLIKGQLKAFGKEGFSVMMQQFNPHKFTCLTVKGADKDEIIKVLKGKK